MLANLKQISPIIRIFETIRLCRELINRNPSFDKCDFLGTSNHLALPVLDGPHKFACLEKAIVRSGIQPRKSTPKLLDPQLSQIQIGPINVGDLEFSSARRLQRSCNIYNRAIIEI